jgi:hypothetical protein
VPRCRIRSIPGPPRTMHSIAFSRRRMFRL